MSEIRAIPQDILALIGEIWGEPMVIEVLDTAQRHHDGRSFREMISSGDEGVVRQHLAQLADGTYT